MSATAASRRFIFNTAMGPMVVNSQAIVDFDVEDVVRTKAISQMRLIEYVNLGQSININKTIPQSSIPSVFVGATDTLPEG